MNISNKRKRKYKLPILINLGDIPKDFDIEKFMEYYKQTGMIITNEGALTKREYEERRSIYRNEI